MLVLLGRDDWYDRAAFIYKLLQFYNLNNFLSASVMIFSVAYLRRKVSSLETKMISSRQGLMISHFAIFTLSVALSILIPTFTILVSDKSSSYFEKALQAYPDPVATGQLGSEMCRFTVYNEISVLISAFLFAVLLVLYSYMSWQFSLPLKQNWRQMYPEGRQAERRQEAALRDANRIIQRMQALVE